jgi:hypothetical protein
VTASPPDDWAERFVAIEPRKTTDLEAKEQSGDGSHRYAVGAVTDSCIRAMRVLRERRGWSALHLSRLVEEQAGVYLPRSVITNLENGRRRDMSVEQLVALVQVFDSTLGYFLGLGDTACGKCNDAPPEGYACLTCGAH